MKEVNDLLKRLGELEDAPLIWINKKVYDMAQEIKILKEEYMILQNASDEVEEEKDKEIERLKQGYCELKEKCNRGECDCTNEEYNGMCEQNIKMDLEIERLNNKIDKAIEKIESVRIYGLRSGKTLIVILLNEVLDILKGSDKE